MRPREWRPACVKGYCLRFDLDGRPRAYRPHILVAASAGGSAMKTMTIGDAARQACVGVETIRFYERRGLVERPPLPPGRRIRVYPAEAVKRIRFIRQAQQLGFSLREIEELLAVRADPRADCSEVRAQAVAKLREVRGKIEQLGAIGAALEAVIAVCPGQGGLQACSILDTLVEPDRAVRGGGPLPAAPPKRKAQDGSGSLPRRGL
jgi:MerR family transcriptional regulator, copper efflux regulator